jgi:hypothetical protein
MPNKSDVTPSGDNFSRDLPKGWRVALDGKYDKACPWTVYGYRGVIWGSASDEHEAYSCAQKWAKEWDEKPTRGGKREGAGAKPKGDQPRVVLRARIDQEAQRRIDAECKRRGVSLGDYLSAHGLTLPCVPKSAMEDDDSIHPQRGCPKCGRSPQWKNEPAGNGAGVVVRLECRCGYFSPSFRHKRTACTWWDMACTGDNL